VTGSPERVRWADQARGLAILLVICFHAESIAGRFVEVPEIVGAVNRFFAPYRMPVSMFVSGAVVALSVRRPAQAFWPPRLRQLAWPYLLWSAVFLVVADRVEVPKSFFAVLLVPPTYLWYLWFLLAYYTVARIMMRLRIPVSVVIVGGWVVSFLPDVYRVPRFGLLMSMFFLGFAVATRWGLRPPPLPRARWCLGLAGLVMVVFGLLSAWRVPVQGVPLLVLVPVLGCAVALWGLSSVPDTRWLWPLEVVGRHAIVFYVVHFPLVWVVDRELARAGVQDGGLVYSVGLAAALLAGAGLTWARSRVPGVDWLFAWGGDASSRTSRTDPSRLQPQGAR
jgi:peptidoglycan/LPS O-acetylase OafA/YrhL